MNESELLALELEKALQGPAWHGPSWRETLEGVGLAAALRRPIPEAHTIGEIVLHQSTWLDAVRRRFAGETPQVPPEMDWRPGAFAGEAAWAAAVEETLATGRELVRLVRAFPPGRWQTPRPGLDSSWYELAWGEALHVQYHAGQVAVLRKAAAANA